ncbi:MAG: PIN domain-containing protein [Candidatus Omnitrophica bacterium]|nr:PIN domain-containing protein [Candidatus Omnitrophota bacterium]
MVLVDTSVWVAHLREGDRRLSVLLTEGRVITHDFVIGELACGSLKNRKEILSLLKALPHAPLVTQEEILDFIDAQSLNNLGIGFIDAHLLASAAIAEASLWTLDHSLILAADRLKLSHRP